MGLRTSWDTAPNPRLRHWTSVNAAEILPGVVSPLVATTFNRFDATTLRTLMGAYPAAEAVPVFDPPVANFMGIAAGRLSLNTGFTVAAMSGLEPQIAAAMAQQFFTGADDTAGYMPPRWPASSASPAC